MPSPTDHETANELLPWLVTGTLPDDERRAVERHVRDCLSCRAALKDERRLATLVGQDISEREALNRNFEKLVGRLDRRRDARRFMPRAAAAAAVLLAAVLAGAGAWSVFGNAGGGAPAEFSTATGSAANAGMRLDVVFAEETTEAEIAALLAELDATIVGGPSELGRYTIRLSGRPLDDDELAALLARLGADERVRFAGRSFIENTAP